MLLDWAWGDSKTPSVQRFAAAGVREGIANPALESLARLGSSGVNSQNVHRDLVSRFCKGDVSPYILRLEGSTVDAMVYPHEWFHVMFKSYDVEFVRRLGATPKELKQFWAEFKSHPKGGEMVRNHQHLRDRSDELLSRTIPLMAHCDAGPISNRDSACILSWGSAAPTAHGSDRQCRFPVAAWSKLHESGHALPNKVWQEFMHSMACLARGRFARCMGCGVHFEPGSWRHAERGKLLAPEEPDSDKGWCGVLIGFKGDLDWMCNELGLNHFNSSGHPCGYCLANRDDRPWNYFSNRAAWLETCFDANSFCAWYRRGAYHPLFDLPGMSPQFLPIDILHIMYYKGVASHALGNVLFELTAPGQIPGCNSRDAALRHINQRLKAYYESCKVSSRIPPLKLKNLINERGIHDDAPQLRGRDIKAAATKQLVGFVVELAREYNSGSEHDLHRKRAVELLADFSGVLDGGGTILTQREAASLHAIVFKFLKHYAWLAQEATAQGSFAWAVQPKHHYMAHLGLQQSVLNPKNTSTFLDESLVGRVCAVFAASLDGPSDRCLQTKVLTKYLLALKVLFSKGSA